MSSVQPREIGDDAENYLLIEQDIEPRRAGFCYRFCRLASYSTCCKVAAVALGAGFLVAGITSAVLSANYSFSPPPPPPAPSNITKLCELLPSVGRPYLSILNTSSIQNTTYALAKISRDFCSGAPITNPNRTLAAANLQSTLQTDLTNEINCAVTGCGERDPADYYVFLNDVITGNYYSDDFKIWHEDYTYTDASLTEFRTGCLAALYTLCAKINSLQPVFSGSSYSCVSLRGYATKLIHHITGWENVWPG